MSSTDLMKEREILFSKTPQAMICKAADDLRQLGNIQAQAVSDSGSLRVTYDLREFTLEDIEEHLVRHGHQLDDGLLAKLNRACIHYLEETELHNLGAPEKRLKHFEEEAYVHAWEHHMHGDHDDTPPEWRQYK